MLSPGATSLYERLLRNGGCQVEPVTDRATRELLDRGLAVALSEPPRLVPVPPVAGLTRTLADAVSAVAHEQEVLAHAYREASRLQHLHLEAQHGWEVSGHVAVLRGDAVPATVTSLIRGARHELLHLNTGHYRRPPTLDTLVEPDQTAMAAGLRVRSVYSASFLKLAAGEPTIRQSQRIGEHVRVSDEVPMKLYLADDEIAVVPLLLEVGEAAVLLRATDVIRALRVFFELLWERASPWPGAGDPQEEPLTPTQRRVLELLGAGFTDDQVASALGVTARTVRRHVAAIMGKLDTPTRFATALAARRRGWL